MWAPHVTVAAVAEQDGRFLLVEEAVDGNIVLNQPAGHLDEGESLIQAVIRETLEESGYHFCPSALVGLYRWQHPDTHQSFLRFTFCGQLAGRTNNITLDEAILRVIWLDRGELARQPARLRSPMVLRAIDDYQAGRRYSLHLLCDLP